MLALWREKAGADWKTTFRQRLETHGRHFEAEGNPLDAWDALLLARALGEAPPQWALDYLAISAAGIFALRADSMMKGKKVKPAMIGRALGMVSRGAGKAFPGQNHFEWVAIAVQIREAIKAGRQETYAIGGVAEDNGISESTARAAWKRFQASCPDLL